LLPATAALLFGQSSRVYTFDPSGTRVEGTATVVRDGRRVEANRSINGGMAPVQKVDERILRSDSSGKVVERIIKRFGPDGEPFGSERVLIEEQKQPGGGSTVRTTVWRSQMNGQSRLVERSTAETRRSGQSLSAEVVVERPNAEGRLQMAERSTTSGHSSASGSIENTIVYRLDANGRFREAEKHTVEKRTEDGRSVETATRYQAGSTGRMELSEMSSRSAVKQPDGSESVVVDVYGTGSPGMVNAQDGKPRLRERQFIERQPTADGLIESLSVSRADVSDPSRLGPSQKIRETICKGKCEP
jgi:hypothetical protein